VGVIADHGAHDLRPVAVERGVGGRVDIGLDSVIGLSEDDVGADPAGTDPPDAG
jgi:hypothetical protein